VVSGQWAVGSGQWAVGSGQWAVGSGQWAVGSGSATAVAWQITALDRDRPQPVGGQSAMGRLRSVVDAQAETYRYSGNCPLPTAHCPLPTRAVVRVGAAERPTAARAEVFGRRQVVDGGIHGVEGVGRLAAGRPIDDRVDEPPQRHDQFGRRRGTPWMVHRDAVLLSVVVPGATRGQARDNTALARTYNSCLAASRLAR